MTFDELVENLVYSAAMTLTINPPRMAPDALLWATNRLRSRCGDQIVEQPKSEVSRNRVEIQRRLAQLEDALRRTQQLRLVV